MKNVVSVIVALIVAWVIWSIVKGLIFATLALAFKIAMIALFVWLAYTVYQAMNRNKLRL